MKKLLCVLLLLPRLLGLGDLTEVEEETARQTGVYQVEESLQEDERALSGELRLDGGYDAQGALGRLWERFLRAARESLAKELGFAVRLVLIALCCSLCGALCPGTRIPPWMEITACCTAVTLLAGSLDGVMGQALATLNRLQDYALAAFPAFFTTVAACGATASAAVRYASVSFAAELFMKLSQDLVLPLIEAYLAVSVCSAIFDNPLLQAVSRIGKWCACTGMSLLTLGFCTYIGISGVISGSADAAAVKAAKTVLASALPVVGGILSDSASGMLAAASLIKNSAGVFCLIAVCCICVVPFAVLAVKLLVFKAAAALASLGGSERYSRLISGFGSAFGMLLGLVGSFGFMLFFSFLSGIRVVSPI